MTGSGAHDHCLRPDGHPKKAYRSAAKARKAARLARGGQRARRLIGHAIYIYECPTCGRWHLTGNEQHQQGGTHDRPA
jgi:hypothetical protein